MSRRSRWLIGLVLVGFVAFLAVEWAVEAKSCGFKQERAKPHRRKAGESVPPLPLPATPLRRTEKKRPPAPPALVGKLEYGKTVWSTDKSGRRFSYRDWTTDPLDIINLMKLTNKALGIRYRSIKTSFEQFSYRPDELPILFLTGHEAIGLSQEQRGKLRWFLQDGGFLIAEACCGMEDFWKAFLKEMTAIFPRRKLHQLADDHPVFDCYYQLADVKHYSNGKLKGTYPPIAWGINLGCRTSIFLSTEDLSCGWDGHNHETGVRIPQEDSRKVGINMLTYCLAHYKLGRFLSSQKRYYQSDQHTRDQFVFGQVVHDGDWDPTPNGIMSLLKFVTTNSTMEVQFKRAAVDLRQAAALQHPILYMSGHYEMSLSEGEIAGLRNYLRNGGMLLADTCCGRKAFDRSFRVLLTKVLPGMTLQRIPLSHPLYSSRVRIGSVEYSGKLRQQHPDLKQPTLEGVSINGQLAVIYSRYGLGTQWDGQVRPYALAYSTEDALRIGLNIMVYAMTH